MLEGRKNIKCVTIKKQLKNKKMSYITLEGMEFFSYHGCFKEEQVIGTNFVVDLKIETDVTEAAITDDLHKTINYQSVYLLVKEEMKMKSKLLENVAQRILTSLLNHFPAIINIEVKVSKLNPPLGGKLRCVSLIMEGKR